MNRPNRRMVLECGGCNTALEWGLKPLCIQPPETTLPYSKGSIRKLICENLRNLTKTSHLPSPTTSLPDSQTDCSRSCPISAASRHDFCPCLIHAHARAHARWLQA